jgi:zeta-carotene desaturase
VREILPSTRDLNMTWSSVVKLAKSLYREAPGMDVYRPDQKTPIANFFLAGSYTMQDYIDSMEGATISGRRCAGAVLGNDTAVIPTWAHWYLSSSVNPSANFSVFELAYYPD